ncbi:anaphase-promoting complex, cyclosome, subunit 4-domain-containing protein [Calycina marina]|uniref:Anaphase-promoting complex subunit 4 n=1 Tax=Calycina marina TaxID=1763456 RepID=A0A9P7Z204_9HELO|nr:anaphase-promoting complex, cyclosome, subunit 4-domain-containing protein [Calycina marina]
MQHFEMGEPEKLSLLSEKTLPCTANAPLIKYCPSMDLVAIGSTDNQVLIYRLNGQRVYGASPRPGSAVRAESICWKPNGQLLAIAWSDGWVRLVGADSSKIVHQFCVGDDIDGITCIGWASNFTSSKAILKDGEGPKSWDEIFGQDDDFSDKKSGLDLPRDLSLIDIEVSMPKLSILGASGNSSEEVFSSKSSLDPLFKPFDPKDNDAVHVMVVGTREGGIHLSIYDSFVIGSFKSPVMIGDQPSYLIHHASHPEASTHTLLMKATGPASALYFVPMDLRFVSSSSGYLSLLASRSTTLQNLLRYIRQVQVLMLEEWKTTQDLPSKFLRNINETLEEDGNRNIVQALYHSVATGHTFPAVKEWLVDELAERGHKRWDKAVATGLENIRCLVHENLLPALDRCSVILSRFSGIARFQGSNDGAGFTSQQISQIMDTVACLHLVASKILMQVVDELELFTAFSAWLRYEIDRLASDSSNSSNEDANDKEASIDHGKVLLYLQTVMLSSPLAAYFVEPRNKMFSDFVDPARIDGSLFSLLDKEIQKHEKGLPCKETLLQLDSLCAHLTEQASAIFHQIAESEKRNVLFGEPYDLGTVEDEISLDMRVESLGNNRFNVSIALIPSGTTSTIQVVLVGLVIKNGVSNVASVSTASIKLGGGQIKDIKLADAFTMLILWASTGTTHLLSVPYQHGNPASVFIYQPREANSKIAKPLVIEDQLIIAKFTKYTISGSKAFESMKLEIREQSSDSGKEDTRRIVVLGEDKSHYKVFKMPDAEKKVKAKGVVEDIFML